MNSERLFGAIWRANAVLLLVVLLGVSAMMASSLIDDLSRTDWRPAPVQMTEGREDDTVWRLDHLERLAGTDFAIIALRSDTRTIDVPEKLGNVDYFSGGYRQGPTRNILFINLASGEQHWLFESSDVLITHTRQLPGSSGPPGEATATRALLYFLIERDTDGDGQLTTDDRVGLALSGPDGRAVQRIAPDIDRIIGVTRSQDDTLLLVFQRDGVARSVTIDLVELTVSPERRLPGIDGKSPSAG